MYADLITSPNSNDYSEGPKKLLLSGQRLLFLLGHRNTALGQEKTLTLPYSNPNPFFSTDKSKYIKVIITAYPEYQQHTWSCKTISSPSENRHESEE